MQQKWVSSSKDGALNGRLISCTDFVEMAIRIAPRRTGTGETGNVNSGTSTIQQPTISPCLNMSRMVTVGHLEDAERRVNDKGRYWA
jgi:hypothetical protein